MNNPNILAERYSSEEIRDIFSNISRIKLERTFWVEIMKIQQKMGVLIQDYVIEKYEKAIENIDFNRITDIEMIRRHDIKARIEAFNEAAKIESKEQHIHKGMTSRDLSDNIDQIQIKKASEIIFNKLVHILKSFLDKAEKYKEVIIVGRTHMQPAQPTTLGRRMAMFAEELLHHLKGFENFIEIYPFRGIKGPVSTQLDMINILGNENNVVEFERIIAKKFGFNNILISPGQIYPRSLDAELIQRISLMCSSLQNFSNTIRLMAREELITEGFQEGQVGSSSMPHKMNTRSSERIWSLSELIKSYVDASSRISGSQWEEGDVSESAIRRIIIPDCFYAMDGICLTTLTILNEMKIFPQVIDNELTKYIPFLATSEILTLAVQCGAGREESHEVIKKHAINTINMIREGKIAQFSNELSKDLFFINLGIDEIKINEILKRRELFLGRSKNQIAEVSKKASYFFNKYPSLLNLNIKSIL
ncbi:MAG: adenylosuccinate lyase [Nanoarchaeota archaeon]